jgi:hypothetical protein
MFETRSSGEPRPVNLTDRHPNYRTKAAFVARLKIVANTDTD